MRVRLYSLRKKDRRVNGNSLDGFVLESFEDDLRDLPDAPSEDLAPVLSKECRKDRVYVGYTTEVDPEYLYSLAGSYAVESRLRHALRLWAQGKVEEHESLRVERGIV